jgi:hypothetical protein
MHLAAECGPWTGPAGRHPPAARVFGAFLSTRRSAAKDGQGSRLRRLQTPRARRPRPCTLGLLVGLPESLRGSSSRRAGEYRHTRGPYQPEYMTSLPADATSSSSSPSPWPAALSLAMADSLPHRRHLARRAAAPRRPGLLRCGRCARAARSLHPRVVHDAPRAEVEAGPVSASGLPGRRGQFDGATEPGARFWPWARSLSLLPKIHVGAPSAGGSTGSRGAGGATELWQLGGGLGGALGF